MTIRPATLDDIDWLIELARERYAGKFDEEATRAWMLGLARECSEEVMFLRGDHAALVAVLQRPFYNPADASVHMIFAAARPNRSFEGYRMMEVMVEWGRSLGASVHFGEQCGIDLEPIARRLGAVLDRPSWTVEV